MTATTSLKHLWASAFITLALCFGVAFNAHAEDQGGNGDPQIEQATSTDGEHGVSGIGGTVGTGNAQASTTINNDLNTTTVNPDKPGELNGSGVNSTASSTGELGSFSTTSALTGQNTAEGGEGLATVITGNATATANVVSKVNTNVFNSRGIFFFLNQLFGKALDLTKLDLSFFFRDISTTTDSHGCTILTCANGSHILAQDTNTATVTNSVIVRADTGSNTATTEGQGDDKDALIKTGYAYAAANLINFVNTNIINSNFLILAFNNFGPMHEDITLPSPDFFKKLFNAGGSAPQLNGSSVGINASNTAALLGTTTVTADTGDNVASSTGEGHGNVLTGDAYSSANVANYENTNYIGGTSVVFTFNVWGDFSGIIKDLPEQLIALTTPGHQNFDGSWAPGSISIVSPNAQCSDEIDNDADGLVDSADPKCHVDNHASDPTSYDRFGMSESVGQCSDGKDDDEDGFVDEVDPGCHYKFDMDREYYPNAREKSGGVFNGSNLLVSATSTAHVENNVNVSATTGGNYAETASGTAQVITGDAYAIANVLNFINTNIVEHNLIFGLFNIFGDFSGNIKFGDTGLGEAVDNFDETVVVTPPSSGGGSGGGSSGGGSTFKVAKSSGGGAAAVDKSASGDPQIKVTKTASVKKATAPVIVDYKVVVENNKMAGNAYNGVLTDTLTDPFGGVMLKRSWDLGTIVPGDNITLTYSVEFGATSSLGVYKNTARVDAVLQDGKHAVSAQGSMNVNITAGGVVLGESTDECPALITTFLRRGSAGNEVSKLQTFLNLQGSHLPVTGMFGPMTEAAVKVFQRTYATEILAPAGLSQPTGNVYAGTQRKINSLGCGGVNPVAIAPMYSAPKVAAAPAAPVQKPAGIFKTKTVADLQPAPAPATTSITKTTWNWLSNLLPF
ncbi:peptidoglycan-binding protein [Candidatus Parcubacteria bacterium]|nr:peptidoglycan-binding protein [Candidatus Parcubacteria bacterium]